MVLRRPHDLAPRRLNADTLVRLTSRLGGMHASSVEYNRGRTGIEHPLVTVVDDDESVRESLPDLLKQFGFSARAFSSAEEFLSSDCVDQTRCLIVDVVMPRITGLDLQRQLKLRSPAIPIIFITGQKEEGIRKRALEQGAVGFLLKPVIGNVLLETVNVALRGNREFPSC
jgi:FixJ family two-component response regulator